jgi:hypothetical protein
MVGPLAAASQALEAAGAGILQKQSLASVGEWLVDAAIQLERLGNCIDDLASSITANIEPDPSGTLSSQRMLFAAQRMKEAGIELQGKPKPKPQGKAWLKG